MYQKRTAKDCEAIPKKPDLIRHVLCVWVVQALRWAMQKSTRARMGFCLCNLIRNMAASTRSARLSKILFPGAPSQKEEKQGGRDVFFSFSSTWYYGTEERNIGINCTMTKVLWITLSTPLAFCITVTRREQEQQEEQQEQDASRMTACLQVLGWFLSCRVTWRHLQVSMWLFSSSLYRTHGTRVVYISLHCRTRCFVVRRCEALAGGMPTMCAVHCRET
jgi:hypothetical protein